MIYAPQRFIPGLALVVCSLALGVGIVANLPISFLVVAALLGMTALAAPAGSWILMALVAALAFRGLVQLNVLPAVATYIDLPLAWGALAVALLKRSAHSPLLGSHLRRLGVLALAVGLAWLFSQSEVLRPVLYLALLGEPFAIVGAFLAEPPTQSQRRTIERALFVLLVIQIPVAIFQFATLGAGDPVPGNAVRRRGRGSRDLRRAGRRRYLGWPAEASDSLPSRVQHFLLSCSSYPFSRMRSRSSWPPRRS